MQTRRRTPCPGGLCTAAVALLLVAAGTGPAWAAPAQDVLAPAGPQAAHIRDLWYVTLAVCALVFAAVLATLVWVLWRRPRAGEADAPDLAVRDRPERRTHRSVAVAVATSTLLLLFLIVASVLTDYAL